MNKLICKIFGHNKKYIATQKVSLKRWHVYCVRCNERLQTNIKHFETK